MTVDAGDLPGACGLLAGIAARSSDDDGTIGGSAGWATARASRERLVAVRGFSLAASSRARRKYVRKAATETGTPCSESIAATAVQL